MIRINSLIPLNPQALTSATVLYLNPSTFAISPAVDFRTPLAGLMPLCSKDPGRAWRFWWMSGSASSYGRVKVAVCSLALISSLVATANASGVNVPRQYCPAVIVPTPAITADGTGVSGLELGNGRPISATGQGPAILTTSGYEGWNFGNGGLGSPWCPTSRWLNIGSSTYPWKPLSWSSTRSTTSWETGYGVYLTAAATSDYPETSNYLACKPITPSTSFGAPDVQWLLFLLTSDTLPTVSDDTLSGANITTCVKTKLFIGSGNTGANW